MKYTQHKSVDNVRGIIPDTADYLKSKTKTGPKDPLDIQDDWEKKMFNPVKECLYTNFT